MTSLLISKQDKSTVNCLSKFFCPFLLPPFTQIISLWARVILARIDRVPFRCQDEFSAFRSLCTPTRYRHSTSRHKVKSASFICLLFPNSICTLLYHWMGPRAIHYQLIGAAKSPDTVHRICLLVSPQQAAITRSRLPAARHVEDGLVWVVCSYWQYLRVWPPWRGMGSLGWLRVICLSTSLLYLLHCFFDYLDIKAHLFF